MEGGTPAAGGCPGCGIQVMPGYPRCPRCHSPLPAAASPRAPRIATQGGTSLGPNRTPWIAAGIGALALVVVVAVVASGGDEAEPAAAGAADAGLDAAVAAAAAEPQPATAPGFVDDEPDPGAGEASLAQATAAQDLEALLTGRRLWAKVSPDEAEPTTVVVRSAECEAADMRPALAEARAALVEAGFTELRCIARHGGLVFEEPL